MLVDSKVFKQNLLNFTFLSLYIQILIMEVVEASKIILYLREFSTLLINLTVNKCLLAFQAFELKQLNKIFIYFNLIIQVKDFLD